MKFYFQVTNQLFVQRKRTSVSYFSCDCSKSSFPKWIFWNFDLISGLFIKIKNEFHRAFYVRCSNVIYQGLIKKGTYCTSPNSNNISLGLNTLQHLCCMWFLSNRNLFFPFGKWVCREKHFPLKSCDIFFF